MTTRSLAGYLIAIGPILMMAIFIGVWDSVIGGAEDGAVGEALVKANIEAGLENISLTKLVAFLAFGGFFGMMLGLTLWARSLRGEGKKGASLATVASIVIPVAAASFMLSMDFNFAAADAWDKGDTGNALIVGAVAEYAPSDLLGMVMMLSVSFIGLAAILQSTDKISRSLGSILAVFSLAMFLLSFTSIDGGPIWMLWMLTIVAAGVNLIRLGAGSLSAPPRA